RVIAVTGTSPHGQGLATSFAQLIADELGLHIEDVTVLHGDTAVGPKGKGTMGSRSLQLGGTALRAAAQKVRETLLRTAADMLEVSADDLVLEGGQIYPIGAPERSVAISDAVRKYLAARSASSASVDAQGACTVVEGIQATVHYAGDGESFPFGTTIAVVAVD